MKTTTELIIIIAAVIGFALTVGVNGQYPGGSYPYVMPPDATHQNPNLGITTVVPDGHGGYVIYGPY